MFETVEPTNRVGSRGCVAFCIKLGCCGIIQSSTIVAQPPTTHIFVTTTVLIVISIPSVVLNSFWTSDCWKFTQYQFVSDRSRNACCRSCSISPVNELALNSNCCRRWRLTNNPFPCRKSAPISGVFTLSSSDASAGKHFPPHNRTLEVGEFI